MRAENLTRSHQKGRDPGNNNVNSYPGPFARTGED
jgi:hypothetical protein